MCLLIMFPSVKIKMKTIQLILRPSLVGDEQYAQLVFLFSKFRRSINSSFRVLSDIIRKLVKRKFFFLNFPFPQGYGGLRFCEG